MAKANDATNPSELVDMTARARRVLSAVKDGRAVFARDDHNALHMLRLVLREIALRTGAVPEIEA